MLVEILEVMDTDPVTVYDIYDALGYPCDSDGRYDYNRLNDIRTGMSKLRRQGYVESCGKITLMVPAMRRRMVASHVTVWRRL